MAERGILVMAIPLAEEDDSDMTLECSECGVVGIVGHSTAEADSIEHIKSHGGIFLGETDQ